MNQDEVYALRPTDARERKARVKTSHLNQGVGDKAQHAEKMAWGISRPDYKSLSGSDETDKEDEKEK